MKKCFLAFGILVGSIFGVSNTDVSAEENNKVEANQLIENFKEKHPDWTFTEVTADEIAKNKEESVANSTVRASAPPVTALYVDEVGSQLDTANEYYESIGSYQLTSHAVKGKVGIGVVEMGYGNSWQWLGSEQITYSHPDYDVRSIAIDINNDNIVDGYYHAVFFNSDVKIQTGSSELYKFRSISRNYPWNTMETSINIPHL